MGMMRSQGRARTGPMAGPGRAVGSWIPAAVSLGQGLTGGPGSWAGWERPVRASEALSALTQVGFPW